MNVTDVDNRPRLGQIVRVKRGRDVGMYAIVIGRDDPHFVLIADGDQRKYDRPKKKNIKHIQVTRAVNQEVADVLRVAGRVNNAKLRYALNQYLLKMKQSEQKGE
ncbi:KOW domain-containing RNA-binding protein [Hazenella sp. IB182357]|uniref:KOW domain-containing RNA-binding protein n=1 Tax=Polycladospora coralii TaxID=2771432 RepID=A0A926NB04_9BACL|nr:KOW domain-containing RNA-binding protein [Polycladospora coralii]MBD1372340.1 KOW domain-containing RNA-binding protein [Polycladospora coralii]MBS7531470.1 KOW domain-containing RNA-binding protein [Polycladospora coralii]